ncbi:MAG TPA: hypothetical protein EYH44_01685 [Thermoprotei archaeon]|nr:hypothetical protein [Thermoprotei archaeon]
MLAVVIHNIYSSVKLVEAVDVYLEFPEVDILVISKAVSSAAQSGVPEAEKKAYLRGRRVLYVPNLEDVVEVLNLDRLYMIVPKRLGKSIFDPEVIRKELVDRRIGLVFTGGDMSFTSAELSLGIPTSLGFNELLPASSLMAISLFLLYPKI